MKCGTGIAKLKYKERENWQKYVYLLLFEDGVTKVGVTTQPEKRFKNIENSSGRKIKGYYLSKPCANAHKIESKILNRFSENRVKGEFFKNGNVKEMLDIIKTHPKKEGEKPCENDISELMSLLFGEYKIEKPKIHCKICMCPIDLWNPLKTYKSDKSCWLVEDLLGILHKHEKEFIKVEDLIKEIKKEVEQYEDIPDVGDTVEELLFIAKDIDRITEEEKGKYFVY